MWHAFVETWKNLGFIAAVLGVIGLLACGVFVFIWLGHDYNPLWYIGSGVVFFCYLWGLVYFFEKDC